MLGGMESVGLRGIRESADFSDAPKQCVYIHANLGFLQFIATGAQCE